MEVITQRILKKEVAITDEEVRDIVRAYIEEKFPNLLDKDDEFKEIKDGVALFEYDPEKENEELI